MSAQRHPASDLMRRPAQAFTLAPICCGQPLQQEEWNCDTNIAQHVTLTGENSSLVFGDAAVQFYVSCDKVEAKAPTADEPGNTEYDRL